MLTIGNPLKGSDCGNYYTRISSEEYYAAEGCQPGKWRGSAVHKLIGSAIFNAETFSQLLNGFDVNGKPLVQNAGHEDRWRGWDLTLSAPKSVSVLWALSPKKARKLIRKAHEEAVLAALRWISSNLPFSDQLKVA